MGTVADQRQYAADRADTSLDTGRLDWVSSQDVGITFWGKENGWAVGRNEPDDLGSGLTLRAAIDDAMTREGA
jgi:hypothetical protein